MAATINSNDKGTVFLMSAADAARQEAGIDYFAEAPITHERMPQPEDFHDLADRRAFQYGLEPF